MGRRTKYSIVGVLSALAACATGGCSWTNGTTRTHLILGLGIVQTNASAPIDLSPWGPPWVTPLVARHSVPGLSSVDRHSVPGPVVPAGPTLERTRAAGLLLGDGLLIGAFERRTLSMSLQAEALIVVEWRADGTALLIPLDIADYASSSDVVVEHQQHQEETP